MTTARPILFSAPMVRALLEGRKTQTRRLLKPQPFLDAMGNFCTPRKDGGISCWGQGINGKPWTRDYIKSCRYGVRGDLLWARETWGECEQFGGYLYRATHDGDDPIGNGWRPSIHMPRKASRLTLEITGVKVERLQDISKADVIAEGITERDGCPIDDVVSGWHEPYAQLWDKLNGPGAWDANPWIVALSFTAHKSNVDTYLSQRAEAA